MISNRLHLLWAALPLSLFACSSDETFAQPLAERWSELTVSGVDANLVLQSDWRSGYCADVVIKNNTSAPIKNWRVTLNLRQSTIANVWNGERSGNTVGPVAHNGTVNPGQTATFGFCGNATGTDYLPQVSGLTFDAGSTGGTGGATSTGGTSSSGGATSTGGTTSTGGASATGGRTSTGGTTSSGGTSSSGGTTSTGGRTSTGGTSASGGTTATGGTPATGGTTSGGATLRIDNDWGSGYCATVTTPAGSRVQVQLNASELNNLWNGSYTTSGSLLTVTTNAGASSFGFCARALATTNYRPTLVGSTPGSGGTSGSGGVTGSGGSTGGTSGGGTGGSGGGPSYPPIQTGCSGYATRFWDCCKPHCGWSANVPGGDAMNSCNAQNQTLASSDVQSACSGGSAHTCYGLTPIELSDTLSYGYAATSSGDVCGKCYQLQFTGSSHNAGNDPGSQALAGKTMIVQAINIGYDVGGGQFDLLVPGGGVGAFNACSAQWGVSNSELGAQYGGFLSACKGQVGNNHAALKSCVVNRCDSVFGARGLTDLQQGCHWFADWFEAADNPNLKYKEVACPAVLNAESGMTRPGGVTNSCGN